VNGVASSAGAEVVPYDARSVIGVGMEERRSRRKRMARVVVMVVAAAVDAGWRRAVEDQLEPCPCLACKGRPGIDSFGVNRYRFGLGRKSCLERRRHAPGSGRNSSRGCEESEARVRATSP